MNDFLDSKALQYAARRSAIADWVDGHGVDEDELLAIADYVTAHHPDLTEAAARLADRRVDFPPQDRGAIEQALLEDQIEFGDTLEIPKPAADDLALDHDRRGIRAPLDWAPDEDDLEAEVIDLRIDAQPDPEPAERTHLAELLKERARALLARDDEPDGPRRR